MGENTAIEWAHHTFNPWWGCRRKLLEIDGTEEVDPACIECYADREANRRGFKVWGGDHRFLSDGHWTGPLKWDKRAAENGVRHRVFCASMADVFEDHPDLVESRLRLWELIRETPNLDWLILTKRLECAADLGLINLLGTESRHIWLGTSISSQAGADERLPLLKKWITPIVRFVSYEPATGPVDWGDALGVYVNWLISGGMSGPKAQPSHGDWFRNARDDAKAAGIPHLFKQWGEWREIESDRRLQKRPMETLTEDTKSWPHPTSSISFDGHIIRADSEAEEDTRYRWMERLGKTKAGRALDGRIHNEFPTVSV